MKVYKIVYMEEFKHPDDIELVKEGCMLKYVKEMIKDERISEDILKWWIEQRKHLPETETEAIDLLENDGFYIDLITVYE